MKTIQGMMKKKGISERVRVVLLLCGLALPALLAIFGTLPNGVLGADAPAAEFSAARAMEHIKTIAAEPRPTGSEGNDKARAYILSQLAEMGLEPVIQSTTACGHYPKSWCASPRNIIARIEGTESTDAILLTAHYDSHQYCPCASDDASGVAVLLETARALLSGPGPKNTVTLLFSDAHEWNFQGAAAFITQHSWMEQVRVVFSYDASTSGGPATLLVYDPYSAWIINELPGLGVYPFTSSVLPYFQDHPGGDLTAFRFHGYSGFESGYWASAAYHSSLDTVENFKPASLQHQGSLALAMVHRFGDLHLPGGQPPASIYFNLLHQWMVVYPAGWVWPITGLILAGFAGLVLAGHQRQRLTWSGMGVSALVLVLSLAAAGFLIWVLSALIPLINPVYSGDYLANLQGRVYDQPWLGAAFSALAIALIITGIRLQQRLRRVNLVERALGTQAVLAAGLLGVSAAAPGASYLLAWPLLVSLAAPAIWILSKEGEKRPLAVLPLACLTVSGVVTLLLQVPILLISLVGLPLSGLFFPAILLAVTAGFLAPQIQILTRRRQWLAPALMGLFALGILTPLLLADFDTGKPQYFNLYYVLDADQGEAVWGSSSPPEQQTLALLFPGGTVQKTLPGLVIRSPFQVASAPKTALPPPTVEVIEDFTANGSRTVHLRFTSARGAGILYATVTNPDLTFHSVSVNGIESALPLNPDLMDSKKITLPEGVNISDLIKNRVLFYYEGLRAGESIDVVIEVSAGESFNLIVLDSSFGLPPFSSQLLETLPAGVQLGHSETTVYIRVSLGDGRE